MLWKYVPQHLYMAIGILECYICNDLYLIKPYHKRWKLKINEYDMWIWCIFYHTAELVEALNGLILSWWLAINFIVCKPYHVLIVCHPMFQKLFCTLSLDLLPLPSVHDITITCRVKMWDFSGNKTFGKDQRFYLWYLIPSLF